ncbi:hypothetical protein [Phytohabitans rumicis]|uniref:hypothetical protein n=1 Tax=Phytohabitans rumicis TaxID=1076125 RepID=UPI0031EC915B
MEAAERAAAPAPGAPGVAAADRTAGVPAVHRSVAAAPVRVAPAATGLTVAAARQAAPRISMPARRVLPPPAPPRNPPSPPTRAAVSAPPAAAGRRNPIREYAARLNLIHVLCWQIAVAAVVLAVRQPLPVLVGLSVGAAALVALTAVRVDGRWLCERGALAAGYLCRPRSRELPDEAAKVPALLDLLVPGCTVRSVQTGDGPAMATSHRGGLTVVLRPHSERVPAPRALLSLVDGQPGTLGVQTVHHAGVRRGGPAKAWLAVHAIRAVDAPDDDDLALVLRNSVRRMRRALTRSGTPAQPLAEEAGRALIAGLAHVAGGRDDVREDWRFWRTGGVCQATFQLRGWHRLADARSGRLIAELLTAVPGVAVTVTVAARSGPDRPRVDGVLRLAATTEAAVETALAALAVRAAACGIRLVRLDGTQARGVAASLPIGVFPT